MGWFDYVWLAILAAFQGPEAFSIPGIAIPVTILMILTGFLMGIAVGATPGLAGPMAMAVALPIRTIPLTAPNHGRGCTIRPRHRHVGCWKAISQHGPMTFCPIRWPSARRSLKASYV